MNFAINYIYSENAVQQEFENFQMHPSSKTSELKDLMTEVLQNLPTYQGGESPFDAVVLDQRCIQKLQN